MSAPACLAIYAADSLRRCALTVAWAQTLVRDFVTPLRDDGRPVFVLTTGNDRGPGWGLEPADGWLAQVVAQLGCTLVEYRLDRHKWVDGVLTPATWYTPPRVPPDEAPPDDALSMREAQARALCDALRRAHRAHPETYIVLLGDRLDLPTSRYVEPFLTLVACTLVAPAENGATLTGLLRHYPEPIHPEAT